MRKIVLFAIVIVGIVAVAMFVGRAKILRGHRLELKVYFKDAQGLRVGAPVRLAGVDIGSVTKVRAHPDEFTESHVPSPSGSSPIQQGHNTLHVQTSSNSPSSVYAIASPLHSPRRSPRCGRQSPLNYFSINADEHCWVAQSAYDNAKANANRRFWNR